MKIPLYFVIVGAALLLAGCSLSRSTEETQGDGIPGLLHADWTVFQPAVLFFDSTTPVYGTGAGVFAEFKDSAGVFVPVLGCGFVGDNYGIGAGVLGSIYDGSLIGVNFNVVHAGPLGFGPQQPGHLYGIGISAFSIALDVDGVTADIVPIWVSTRGAAISVWSPPWNDVCGMQIAAVAQGRVDGVQIGLVTDNSLRNSVDAAGHRGCVSVGAVNFTVVDGWQLGIFNSASSGSDVTQVGILNYNEAGFLPWMPIINWNCPRNDGSQVEQ